MKPKIIKTELEYDAALSRIEELFAARPGTAMGDELELLATLVELYEDQQFPVACPDALTAIRFRMEQQHLHQRDLVPFIGSPDRVTDVLAGRRRISLPMMRKLVAGLGIPAEVFLRQPAARRATALPTNPSRQFA